MGANKGCRKFALGLFFFTYSMAEVLQLSYLSSTGLRTANEAPWLTRGGKCKEGDVRRMRLLLL